MNQLRYTVELAGIAAEIRGQYPENRRFFREYLSDRPAALTVEPVEADLREIKARHLSRNPDAARFPAWFWENQALHWKLSEAALSYGVLLFHASALTLDGQAFLFTADSGTGKSTHAELWRRRFGGRVSMLNDDKPFLKVTDAQILAYGSPWDGKRHLSRNAAAPIRAIAELKRDSVNRVERCPDPFRVLYLHALRCAEPSLSLRVLTLEKEIAERVPFYRLGCNMDPEAAEIALQGIERLEADETDGVRKGESP